MNRLDSIVRKKAEIQSRGVQIPPELIEELESSYNAPSIRTGRIVLCLESPAGNGELLPVFIVNGKRGAVSPLRLVKNKVGGFEVHADGKYYMDVSILPRPEFYDNFTSGGIPASKLAVIVGPKHLRSVVNQSCYYQHAKVACKFCAVQNWWNANVSKTAVDIADIIAIAVEEGAVQHISLTTATLNTPGKGLESLVEIARLIFRKTKVPMMLEFEPIADFALLASLLREAKKAGVTTVSCNIECFDENLRPEIMPAKGKVPVEAYRKTWQKCLEIFGQNEVFTVAVAGIGESDDSILRGIEMAAYHGVMTYLVPHSPAVGAAFEDMAAPEADRMLSLYEKASAIYRKHGLNLNASTAGCVRGGGFSGIKDVYNFSN
ncbi:MAG: hypothetical protein A2144_07940 [Chloroflexi bacterium RBG_16_50_9]|nr:MAG: hypothetical protein A2144_07940 [Chloroflexi bacterium RBG_16_50_9]